MNLPKASLDQIFESHIRSLAVTHQPGTLRAYRSAAHRFLRYLHHAYRNSAVWRNSAAIRICWAGFVPCANRIRHCATRPADSI
jgi:hypothetical protein